MLSTIFLIIFNSRFKNNMIQDFSFITNTLHQILTIITSLLFIIIINIVIKNSCILLGIWLYSYQVLLLLIIDNYNKCYYYEHVNMLTCSELVWIIFWSPSWYFVGMFIIYKPVSSSSYHIAAPSSSTRDFDLAKVDSSKTAVRDLSACN